MPLPICLQKTLDKECLLGYNIFMLRGRGPLYERVVKMFTIVQRKDLEEAVKFCRPTCPRCGSTRHILCSAELLVFECGVCNYTHAMDDMMLFFKYNIIELEEYKDSYDIQTMLPSGAVINGVYALLGVDPPGYTYKVVRYNLNGEVYSALLYAFFEVLKSVDAEDEGQLLKIAEDHKNAKI